MTLLRAIFIDLSLTPTSVYSAEAILRALRLVACWKTTLWLPEGEYWYILIMISELSMLLARVSVSEKTRPNVKRPLLLL